ncbi:PQQ-binding-like beta-propeller repeat protein [Armatimonas sp.]|uniref:PQQ-binding-like beta-propeller repeat protein n=1 Tax=Armatimonas sp. TaxID=1872638 RepID=UPI00286A4F26|nr:PQQ-binding-like beta-propeller repeat protein [Armatimonas sp.]
MRTVDDWAQWRGPKRDGHSQETGLLKEWKPAGPTLLWQLKDIGSGYSTPAVVGNTLYVLSNEGMESEFVRAYSVLNGKRLWSTRIGKVGNPDQQPSYPGARSTPTVEGKRLYALGSDGDLVCLDTQTGKPLWKKSLRMDFEGKPGIWAYAESPLVDGNKVIVAPGGASATIIALEKTTGALVWKSALPEGDAASYASAVVMEVGGVRQYVEFLSLGLVGVDAATGKLLWRYDKTRAKDYGVNAPTPIVSGDLIYSAAGAGGGVARIKASAGSYEVETLYNKLKVPNALGGSVKVGDYLYGNNDSAIFMCLEYASGRLVWDKRLPSGASVAYADGHFYLRGGDSTMALAEATPAGYKEKGRFTPPALPPRGKPGAWAYPVISQGRLYLREENCLWTYDIRAKRP